MEKVLYKYNRFGFFLNVYQNRIEINEGAFQSLAKKETIFLKQISSVDVKGLTRKLHITLNSGQVKEYNLGTHSEEAKNVIAELL